MGAEGGGQKELPEHVSPADMDVLMGQDVGEGRAVAPVHMEGKEDGGPEQSVGQGSGDGAALHKADPGSGVGPPPAGQDWSVYRLRVPEACQPPEVGGGEPEGAQSRSGQIEGGQRRERRFLRFGGGGVSGGGLFLLGGQGQNDHRRLVRMGFRLGERRRKGDLLCGLHRLSQRLRPRVKAERGGEREGEQQPAQGRAPQEKEGPLGQAEQREPPQEQNGGNEDPAGEAHFLNGHGGHPPRTARPPVPGAAVPPPGTGIFR